MKKPKVHAIILQYFHAKKGLGIGLYIDKELMKIDKLSEHDLNVFANILWTAHDSILGELSKRYNNPTKKN